MKAVVVRLCCAVFCCAALPALGQSVNIDFGDGAGTPSDDYAAAGLPGVWNSLNGSSAAPQPLVGLDGAPIDARVTVLFSDLSEHHVDDPGTSGNHERLLDDYVIGGTDVPALLLLEGLWSNTYEVITYAWNPACPPIPFPPGCATTLVGTGGCLLNAQVIGGVWAGQLEFGVTHASVVVTVTDGTLLICTLGGANWSGAINGIQLVIGPSDCNANGMTDALDIATGTSEDCNDNGVPDECDADSDGDGTIDACDDCPNDPLKIDPGLCGCGVDDNLDTDNDGVIDCIDECPGVNDAVFAPACTGAIPTVSQWGLVILALLLLVLAKVYFGGFRRQRVRTSSEEGER